MTEHNIFQEIDEDLDRQKLEAMWRRYGPWLLVGAIIIILATAGTTWWRSWSAAKNQDATAGLMEITGQPGADTGKQMGALESFALKNPGTTQATLAQIDAAGLAAKADDKDRAVQLYDGVAKDTKVDPALRQLADLFSVRMQLDTGDPDLMDKRLQALAGDGAPWRYTAMEYQGFLALRTGDKAKARKIFTQLSQDTGVPKNLGARAADMLRFISE